MNIAKSKHPVAASVNVERARNSAKARYKVEIQRKTKSEKNSPNDPVKMKMMPITTRCAKRDIFGRLRFTGELVIASV